MFGWHFHGIPRYFFIDSAYSKMESQTMFEVTNQTVNPPALSDSLGHSEWWHASMIQNNPERSRCTCTVLSWIDTKPQIFEASAPPKRNAENILDTGWNYYRILEVPLKHLNHSTSCGFVKRKGTPISNGLNWQCCFGGILNVQGIPRYTPNL
jgi:hypothetical protein